MKKFIPATAAVALFAATSAFAQTTPTPATATPPPCSAISRFTASARSPSLSPTTMMLWLSCPMLLASAPRDEDAAQRWLDTFEADGETIARDIHGDVRLTRLRDAIIASVSAAGVVPTICARCLREYDQPFEVDFDESLPATIRTDEKRLQQIVLNLLANAFKCTSKG